MTMLSVSKPLTKSVFFFSSPTTTCVRLILPRPTSRRKPVRHAVVLRAVGNRTPRVVVLVLFRRVPRSRITIILIWKICGVRIFVIIPIIFVFSALVFVVIDIRSQGSTTRSDWRVTSVWIWCSGSGLVVIRSLVTICWILGRLEAIAWWLTRSITVRRGLRWLIAFGRGNIRLDWGLVAFGGGFLIWTHRWLVTLCRTTIVVFLNRGLLIGLIRTCRLAAIFLLIGIWWLVRIFWLSWLVSSSLVRSPWLVCRKRKGWEGGKSWEQWL